MSFDSETITTYELGWKTAAFDGQVNSSMAVFYSDYEDVQIPGSIGVDTDNDGVADDFTGVVNNAGKARLWGLEIEGNAILASSAFVPSDSVTARWALGWINAEFKEFLTAVTTNGVTAIQNVAEQRNVQNTPEWTLSLNLNYSRPLQLAGYAGELSLLPALAFRSASSQFEFTSPIDQRFDESTEDGYDHSRKKFYNDPLATDRMAKSATEFFERNKENPFFLYFSLWDVHGPLVAKKEVIEKYKKKWENWPDKTKKWNPKYAAMIEVMDNSVGVLGLS